MIKSPLRYPGGKSRAVKHILPLFPAGINRVISPFMGGGSVEINLSSQGFDVIANDKFYPLINFWYFLQYQPGELATLVKTFYPLSKQSFYEAQKTFGASKDSQSLRLDIAALFYVLNRSSFDGTTLSGGCSNPSNRFTPSAIDLVLNWKRLDSLKLHRLDFKNFLKLYPDDFVFADPPYLISSKLYGQKGDLHEDFDHQALFDLLSQRNGWILCYNDCQEIRELYSKFKIIEPKWSYGMGKNKSSRELLILNF